MVEGINSRTDQINKRLSECEAKLFENTQLEKKE
jgi:hypothetical protein